MIFIGGNYRGRSDVLVGGSQLHKRSWWPLNKQVRFNFNGKIFETFWCLRNLIPILSVIVMFMEFSFGWRIVLQAISFRLGFVVLSVWEQCVWCWIIYVSLIRCDWGWRWCKGEEFWQWGMLFWPVRSVDDSGLYIHLIDECGCIVGRHCWILIISVELRCWGCNTFLIKIKEHRTFKSYSL